MVERILEELKSYPEGIWIRKLARVLNEPVMTIHKYVTRVDNGYPGGKIQIIERLSQELGGHLKIKPRDISYTPVHEKI